MKSFTKTTDEFLLSATVKDVNDFFEKEKNFLIDYHTHLKDATAKADRMTKRHKGTYLGICQLPVKLYECVLCSGITLELD